MAKQHREPSIASALRKLITNQPFRSFDIKTSDGQTFHVFHPDYCMISPGGGVAIVYEKADDGPSIVNLHHVVSMEPTRPRKGMLGSAGKK